MEATTFERTTPTATEPDHAHHWVIDEANGTLSSGRCKRCGAVKRFKNWLEESDFVTNEEYRQQAA